MHDLNSDQELKHILQEARENYQKRIENLKSSMQSIYRETASYSDLPLPYDSSRQDTSKDLVHSLSKIQVLQIENENLKNIIQKETTRLKSSLPTVRSQRESYDLDNEPYHSEVFRLKELLQISEKEIKELKQGLERLNIDNRELEEANCRLRKRVGEGAEEIGRLEAAINEIEEREGKWKSECEKLKKELVKRMNREVDVQELYEEKNFMKMELEGLRKSCPRTTEQLRIHYKEKMKEMKLVLESLKNELATSKKAMFGLEKELRYCQINDKTDRLEAANEKIAKLNQKVEELLYENQQLVSRLDETNENLKKMNENFRDFESVKADCFEEIESLRANQVKITADCEASIKSVQTQAAETSIKALSEFSAKTESIKAEHSLILHEKNEKITELQEAMEILTSELTESQSFLKDLTEKLTTLEETHTKTTENFNHLYSQAKSQHKSDVAALEDELQTLYESKQSLTSELEVMKEKYKVLKNEYLEAQQKLQLNSTICEKQMEEFMKNYGMKEKEIEGLRRRESEKTNELERCEAHLEKLISELKSCEEGKLSMKNMLARLNDEMRAERAKIFKLKDQLRIGVKQLKDEFFQSVKVMHRAAFEEFTCYKKQLSESFQLISGKLSTNLKTMSSTISAQKMQQKQYKDYFLKEAEELNYLRLQSSQLNREITIRDERISYLEASLKGSFSRNKLNDTERLKGLINQLGFIEEAYVNNYKEIVDSVIQLKSQTQKDVMDAGKEAFGIIERKDYLIKSARNEMLRAYSEIEEKNSEIFELRQELMKAEEKLTYNSKYSKTDRGFN